MRLTQYEYRKIINVQRAQFTITQCCDYTHTYNAREKEREGGHV